MLKIYKNYIINYIISINLKNGKKYKALKKLKKKLFNVQYKFKNILYIIESIIYFYLSPYYIITIFKKNISYKLFIKIFLKKKLFKILKSLFA